MKCQFFDIIEALQLAGAQEEHGSLFLNHTGHIAYEKDEAFTGDHYFAQDAVPNDMQDFNESPKH